jgi:hypothetical protein
MGRRHPSGPTKGLERQRLELAAEAARIMATEGQKSFLLAKQKAADRLRVSARQALPSNSEIQQALIEYQRLYGGQERESHLQYLRELALEAMRFFKPFSPRLVGAVLDGTADQFSRVCLHLYTDDPDAPLHHLMAHDVPFSQERRKIRWHRDTHLDIDVLVIEDDGEVIECSIMVGPDAKQAPPSPIDGQPMARASIQEVSRWVHQASPR